MNDYVKVILKMSPAPSLGEAGDALSIDDGQDVLSALLADIGFESFEKEGDRLVAFIPKRLFDPLALAKTVEEFPFTNVMPVQTDAVEEIQGEDWNSEWEKNYFQPYVFGDNECVVHSTFHSGYPKCTHDIVIDPKMAFGTGHHSTTRLMVGALFASELEGKSLIDVGTGSAILAILAEKLKAGQIVAVEIDEAAFVNAVENMALNGCTHIEAIEGDIAKVTPDRTFDYLLANINRNVILDNLEAFAAHLAEGGTMFLSGFYTEDSPVIDDRARKLGLREFYSKEDNNWAILGYRKL